MFGHRQIAYVEERRQWGPFFPLLRVTKFGHENLLALGQKKVESVEMKRWKGKEREKREWSKGDMVGPVGCNLSCGLHCEACSLYSSWSMWHAKNAKTWWRTVNGLSCCELHHVNGLPLNCSLWCGWRSRHDGRVVSDNGAPAEYHVVNVNVLERIIFEADHTFLDWWQKWTPRSYIMHRWYVLMQAKPCYKQNELFSGWWQQIYSAAVKYNTCCCNFRHNTYLSQHNMHSFRVKLPRFWVANFSKEAVTQMHYLY